MKHPWTVLFLCGALCVTGLTDHTADASLLKEDQLVTLYQRLAPATVSLSIGFDTTHPLSEAAGTGVGTGFLIDKTGILLTNAHVIDGATSITATLFDGQQLASEVLAIDAFEDIAILRLPPRISPYPTITLADSSSLRVGQYTFVIGSPFGLGFTLTSGILSSVGPSIGLRGISAAPVIQTTAPINPGNSGGPLVNSDGQVIGVTTATLVGAQNIGFAIPINVAKQVLAEFKARGSLARPWLGIGGKFPTAPMIALFTIPLSKGLLVEDVEDGSPAAEAGLRSGHLRVSIEGMPWVLGGDIVCSLNGLPTDNPDAFTKAVKSLRAGDRISIEIIRNGERMHLSALLGVRPHGQLHPRPLSNQLPDGSAARGLSLMPTMRVTGF